MPSNPAYQFISALVYTLTLSVSVGHADDLRTGSTPAQASIPTPAAEATLLQDAAQDFDRFELDAATKLLDQVEASDGVSADLLYYRIRIHTLRNEPSAALALAEQCIKLFQTVSRCFEGLAEARIATVLGGGNMLAQFDLARGAKSAWERAVELDPTNTRAALLLLRYCRQAPWIAGGSESRARELERALAKVSAAAGEQARGLNLLSDKKFDESAAALKSAIALDPTDRDPKFYLAFAELLGKRYDNAALTLEGMVREYPKFWEAWYTLGEVHRQGELNPARGLEALNTYLGNAINPVPQRRAQAFAGIGQLHELLGDKDAALAAFRNALSADDGNKAAKEGLRRLEKG